MSKQTYEQHKKHIVRYREVHKEAYNNYQRKKQKEYYDNKKIKNDVMKEIMEIYRNILYDNNDIDIKKPKQTPQQKYEVMRSALKIYRNILIDDI